MIFACKETEAWELMRNRTNWMRADFKIIGTGDGKIYAQTIKDSRKKADVVKKEIDAMLIELKRYEDTEQKLVYEELADPEDNTPAGIAKMDKLRKVRKILKDYSLKMQEKEKVLHSLEKGIVQTAFDAELLEARKHIERPSNQNIITPGSSGEDRAEILRMFGSRKG